VLLYLERDVFSSVQLAHILPAVASIDPCAQQQKLVKLVLPVENLMYSSVNLDGGYMKRDRSFARSGFSSAQKPLPAWYLTAF
jgi:type II secretory pathway component PulL